VTKKVELSENMSYGGDDYDPSDNPHELPDAVAERAEEKDIGTILDDEDDGENIEINTKDKPVDIEVGESEKKDILDNMKDKLDEEPTPVEKWNPEQTTDMDPEDHPRLVGEIKDKNTSDKHDTKLLEVEDEEGDHYLVFAHKVLEDLIEKANVGDFVAVNWTGRDVGDDSGVEYMTYRYELWDRNGEEKMSGGQL